LSQLETDFCIISHSDHFEFSGPFGHPLAAWSGFFLSAPSLPGKVVILANWGKGHGLRQSHQLPPGSRHRIFVR
jgi:hypothetical protein